MSRLRASLAVFAATAIWAFTFPLVKAALPLITPLALNALRFATAALFVLPALRGATRDEWKAGLVLGGLIAGGFAVQNVGLQYTTPSRAAFLTSLYVPLTPVLGFLLFGERPGWRGVAGVALAAGGLALLTRPDIGPGGINTGDLLIIACAVAFAAQLVCVTRYSRRFEIRRLLALQIAGAGLLSLAILPLETVHASWTPFLFFALIVEVFGATLLCLHLQLVGQRELSSSQAAIIFAFEPVIAAAASAYFLGDRLTIVQGAGGALILAGMLVSGSEPEPRADASR
jgi:drug/metabolite transporter (DMT)-like permease